MFITINHTIGYFFVNSFELENDSYGNVPGPIIIMHDLFDDCSQCQLLVPFT